MGVTSTNAQETKDLSLELDAETALHKDCSRGTNNPCQNLPSSDAIVQYFTGNNQFITTTMFSTSGMSWGVHQNTTDSDLSNRSKTGFTFIGRGGYSGEYVAQMYAPVYKVKSLDVSFTATGNLSSMTFSIWKISSDNTVTMLASKSSGSWTAGETNTFSASAENEGDALLVYGDRLLLIWNSWTRGQSVTISDFAATAHCIPGTAVDVTFKAQKNGTAVTSFERTVTLPVGQTVNTSEFLPTTADSWIQFEEKDVEVTSSTSEVIVTYTDNAEFPYATSYDALTSENKWVSMFTLNGRMHVYDDESMGNKYVFNNETGEFEKNEDGSYKIESNNSVKRYPCIDRATFTRLSDNFFWGFVCENPLVSPTFKIVNKGAGPDETLYLTRNSGNDPLLLYTADEAKATSAKVTNEWVIEKSSKAAINQFDPGYTYFGVKANGTDKYINNNAGAGYMTTHNQGANADDGSNIKFTSERATYDIMKERALNAPCEAVHSLDQASRDAIKNVDASITEQTADAEVVSKYKTVIETINTVGNGTGFIEFDEEGYYFLRNYTPAGDNQKVYALGSDGTNRNTVEIPADDAGSESVVMKSSNVNLIWKITTANSSEGAPGTGIGASKTIGRKVTNVNSKKQLGAMNQAALATEGTTYYFVELGAGQHFLKDKQYIGNGQQAGAAPLHCDDGGNLSIGGNRHVKNSRDAWYGIRVKSIEAKIGSTGYATIHLPFGVTLPSESDLKAYAVTTAGDGFATLTEVESIPANEGVILKGTANKSYTLTIDDNAAWEEGFTNLLSGSNTHENISKEAYVLSKPEGEEVGLYKAAMAGGTWLNNDNKAYLLVENVTNTEGNARFLSFDFGTETGLDVIKGTEPASSESVVYDLSGRRVRNAQKGMYIVNGKKVIK